MSFDFLAFLSKIDPSQDYEVQFLTGGLVNLTVRARKILPSAGSIFPKRDTLILKYAPPFVAALGEEALFSQDRQVRYHDLKIQVSQCDLKYYSNVLS